MASQSLFGQNNKLYSQQNWKRNLRSAQEGNHVQAENSLDQERQVDRLRGTFANLRNSVLVLGDGNLSFSLALGYLFPKKNILATVLESRKQFIEKFIIAGQANLEQLKNFCPNVQVMFEIDASNINKRRLLEKCPFYTDIVMNFPHHGGKTNLKKSKELLREIFRSVSQCLMLEESTRFHVTLAKGQSGVNPAYIRKGIYFLDNEIRNTTRTAGD
uniref:25S rRNA (uridine-N(3))-methyltransferase BMT5-like domain-containing protein n=1 Tax=Ditylenchus dipsaci TaxID=166011 RepID=A0A915DS21_9BILA